MKYRKIRIVYFPAFKLQADGIRIMIDNATSKRQGAFSQLPSTAEDTRLAKSNSREENWQRWGTYLPERQWGTVREDYSADGNAWNFTHDMARYRAYRWGEDGILGWTDRECRLCFAPSLWNGNDPILKERLFGLGNPEGNHGEDVKEQYYYLDATPTHSYCKGLYKYPQRAFPYNDLVETNRKRGYDQPEYELLDTGIFDEERYFDVQVEYAKAGPEDTLIKLTISNRGPAASDLTVAPTLTFRNNWSWRNLEPGEETRPWMRMQESSDRIVIANHKILGRFRFCAIDESGPKMEEVIFTENDTNFHRLVSNYQGSVRYSKDGFDRYLVRGELEAVNKELQGTKSAFVYRLRLGAGDSSVLRLRLVREDNGEPPYINQKAFDEILTARQREADAFYAERIPDSFNDDERNVSRQAYAGLLWTKQFYYYISERWLEGDPAQPAPPKERLVGKNADWRHLYCRDILSMPDKWEYPWFAAWDTAFHMIPMAEIDPVFAKNQLLVLLREWYMHPNGQMPAYEFSFGDVNPPVHAWAVMHVYLIDARRNEGVRDIEFLERAFQKLLLNFTWWVNRNDQKGHNLFGGGFLGLDNIGVFDRSIKMPDGTSLDQADGTAWMGLYCSSMLLIALELAQTRPAYEDIASKFFEHYIAIIDAINGLGGTGLWNEEDGFYFDQLTTANQPPRALKVHSIVGIVPLYAICILHKEDVDRLPGFRKRMQWFLANKPELARHVSDVETSDPLLSGSKFIALVPKERLLRIFTRLLDETAFLSDHGVRGLSKYHDGNPYQVELAGKTLVVKYVPGEGDSGMFGGNSNWRGPVWFPMNILLLNSLATYHAVYGDTFTVECPTGSGKMLTLQEVQEEIARRLVGLFLRDADGRRPSHGNEQRYIDDPHWKNLVLFSEYFCGDTGRGTGASHQTGWTALAATCMEKMHRLKETVR
ncbi:MGH1-like glycoside hydrolase domain-containing protein [Tunturiibacter gelidoferens]|uniref:Mannosylglycerate hydrolase MGH1-like glycoside hydrolase domain-containing protein n=1 Tax=Tunturiibacter lichenicola TaxID=2051959 RepID=A0A7Y9NLT6_9BACT|nr:glucosidase [Edaphobacter lichenicola]NYF51158.1 hypothetical protein [Edaphobacter lichenicola]